MQLMRKSMSFTQNFPVPIHQISEWKRQRGSSYGSLPFGDTSIWALLLPSWESSCRAMAAEGAGGRSWKGLKGGAIPSGDGTRFAINCFASVFLCCLTLYHLPSTENDACCNAIIPPWLNLKLLQRELPRRGRLFMTALHGLWNYDTLPVHS